MPKRRHLAGHVELVLDRDRHAQQRALGGRRYQLALGVGLIGLQPRALLEHDPERVQLWVEALDPLQVEVDQLARGDLARGDQLGLPGDPGVGEVGGVHARNLVERKKRHGRREPP